MNYLVRFANLTSGRFHEYVLNKTELEYLKKDHIQVLDIMKVKTI
ncbi:hypothetical protein [Metabacillus sp. Hm71]